MHMNTQSSIHPPASGADRREPDPQHWQPESDTGPLEPGLQRGNAALARILNDHRVWRGRSQTITGISENVVSTGFAELDRALAGGWPRRQVIEWLGGPFGCGETRILLPVLAACADAGRQIMLVDPPSTPWIPGWCQWGIDTTALLMVCTKGEEETIWSCEQALQQSEIGVIVTWLDQAREASLRRLRLAVSNSQSMLFLHRPLRSAQQASPAHLRLRWSVGEEGLELDIFKQTGNWVRRSHPVRISYRELGWPFRNPVLLQSKKPSKPWSSRSGVIT
jgi:protein ImuA